MVDLSELIEFRTAGTSEKKTQIILTETKRSVKNYINSLKYRYNGKNPYIPNYVISRDGEIYKIMEPLDYSKYMNNEGVDKKSIIICLENFGWLEKKPLDTVYLNWIGDIYKKEAFKKRWREKTYWHPHDEEKQTKSLVDLLKTLCENCKIPKLCTESNVKYDGIQNFEGIVSKSSYDFKSKDLNPSFDFKLLKKLLKNG
jgi:hypothetical protein